jgi:hypothetical protein
MEMNDPGTDKYQNSSVNVDHNNTQLIQEIRRRWVGNIKMDLREIGWDGMNWIELAQARDQ